VRSIYKSAAGQAAVQERYGQFLRHWPVPNRQFEVATREGATFVVASGPETGPPVVLLHGSGFNSVTWMGDVAAWSQSFRVFAVDVIGHAGRSAPSRPPYDSDRYASWLDDVLAALGVETAAFVGLSLGGWLAIDFATRQPSRATTLVLLAPGGIGRELLSTFELVVGVLPLLLLGERGRRKALAKLLGPTGVPDTLAARAVAEFMVLIAKHFRQNLAKVTRFSDAALARLTMPVLAIVGDRDPLLDSFETQRRLEQHAANAEVLVLRDVGHAVVGQTAAVLQFLRRQLMIE
jgi:pimeloyl-ACP methyl ester carboxylesterase